MKKIFPTELIEFLHCRHIATLKKLGIAGEETSCEELLLLREKGYEFEKKYFSALKGDVVSIDPDAPAIEQFHMTQKAMNEGADWIYQAYLENDHCAGYIDFLKKEESPSELGDFSYSVTDTKLSSRPTPANAVQLIHYAELLNEIQGQEIGQCRTAHSDGSETVFQRDDFIHYYHQLKSDYISFHNDEQTTEPFPVSYCRQCRYLGHCEQYWQEMDHVSQLNSVNQEVHRKLQDEDIVTCQQLYEQPQSITSLPESTLQTLNLEARSFLGRNIQLKDSQAYWKIKQFSEIIFVSFCQHSQAVDGCFSFFMALLTDKGRFEKMPIPDSQTEKQSFQRLMAFIMRTLARVPSTQIIVYTSADTRFLHDLSNRYNICHEDYDELIYKNKIHSFKSLIDQAFVLPVRTKDYLSLAQNFLVEEDVQAKELSQSPQLLFELLDTGDNDRLQDIENAVHARLDLMNKVIAFIKTTEESTFPISRKI